MKLPASYRQSFPSDFPKFETFSVGFDRLFDQLFEPSLLSRAGLNFPPYNIIKESDSITKIEVALAGYKRDEVKVYLEGNMLSIEGKVGEATESEDESKKFVHRGLAQRAFIRQFRLAEGVEIKDASLVDGVLTIELDTRMPDAPKAKQIEIR